MMAGEPSGASPILGAHVDKLNQGRNKVAETEILLRDFDGTRTIFTTELPLREVIHSAVTDLDITEDKTYARTDERDEKGRTIYTEVR